MSQKPTSHKPIPTHLHGAHRRRSQSGGSYNSARIHGVSRLALDDLARLAGDYVFDATRATPAQIKALRAAVKTHLQRFTCGYLSDAPAELIADSMNLGETTVRRHLSTTPSAAWCTFETHLASEVLSLMDRRKIPGLAGWPHTEALEWIALRVAHAAAPTGGWPGALLEPWARLQLDYRSWKPDQS